MSIRKVLKVIPFFVMVIIMARCNNGGGNLSEKIEQDTIYKRIKTGKSTKVYFCHVFIFYEILKYKMLLLMLKHNQI